MGMVSADGTRTGGGPEVESRPVRMPDLQPQYATRRRVLKWIIRAAYGAFALALAAPAIAIKALTTERTEAVEGDRLVYALASEKGQAGQPVRAQDLAVNEGVQAYPSGKADNQSNLIEVVRIAEGEAPEALVAYSAICTHLGCTVYAKLNEDGNIACPCHNSQFKPSEGAAVVGGPAPRPLPSVPLRVAADGVLEIAGEFSGPIGPE